MATSATYTAKILWMAEEMPGWEIVSCHPGFPSPHEAALFGNGFFETSPTRLEIDSQGVRIHLESVFDRDLWDERDGASMVLPSGIRLTWSLPSLDAATVAGHTGIWGVNMTVWRRRPGRDPDDFPDVEIVGDGDFDLVPHATPQDLAATGLHGRWSSCAYDVAGPEGRVEVSIAFDEGTGVLSIEVEDGDRLEIRSGDPVLTVIPKA